MKKVIFQKSSNTLRQMPENYLLAGYGNLTGTNCWTVIPDLAADRETAVEVFKFFLEFRNKYHLESAQRFVGEREFNARYEIVELTLPAHWNSCLINGDFSGFDLEEEEKFLRVMEKHDPGYCVGCSEEKTFTKYHDATFYGVLASDCLDYTFHKERKSNV